jgi:hypothetical protein
VRHRRPVALELVRGLAELPPARALAAEVDAAKDEVDERADALRVPLESFRPH